MPAARCSFVRPDGSSCRFVARRATGLCINHDPSYAGQQQINRERGRVRARRQRHDAVAALLATVDLAQPRGTADLLSAIFQLQVAGLLSNRATTRLLRLTGLLIDERTSRARVQAIANQSASNAHRLLHPNLRQDQLSSIELLRRQVDSDAQ